jgi:hypothetical protein
LVKNRRKYGETSCKQLCIYHMLLPYLVNSNKNWWSPWNIMNSIAGFYLFMMFVSLTPPSPKSFKNIFFSKFHNNYYLPALRGLGTPPTKIVFLGSKGWDPSITKSESLKLHGLICT